MSEQADNSKSIFLAAIENYQPSEWRVYLDGACGDNQELRARVEELLKAHADLGTFNQNEDIQATGIYETPTEKVGEIIGPYKLLQEIGEGGFGCGNFCEAGRQATYAAAMVGGGIAIRADVSRRSVSRCHRR